MMSDWPTEDAATKAVDAAARKLRELHKKTMPPSAPDFDDMPPTVQLEYREMVLPLVWAALASLPDPRYAAWAEGLAHGQRPGVVAAVAHLDNPYTPGE